MPAINLLPDSRRLKESIKQGWCWHAWSATPIWWLKPFSAIAALYYLIRAGIRELPISLFAFVFSTIVILIFLITLPWYLFKIGRNIINGKAEYAVVIDCAPAELASIFQTLFDILENKKYDSFSAPLKPHNNNFCNGTRDNAQWVMEQLHAVGIPCRMQWIRDNSILDDSWIFLYSWTDYGFRVDSDDTKGSLSDMLERILIFYNTPEAPDIITGSFVEASEPRLLR